jgi:hypothetical protein
MGELTTRDNQVGLQRADSNVDAALIQGSAAVHHYAHSVYRQTVGNMIGEAKAIEDDTHFEMTAAHVEATAEQLGNKVLGIADRATDAMERRAEDWRRNSR